ncbi:MAG TPA: hypothetical protein ENN85_02395 [Methanoculleus sp.]|nr:hypothetical protein [Methanoculleus sp.]
MVLIAVLVPAGMGFQVQEEIAPPVMTTEPGSVDYAQFNNSELGFAMEYPDDWSVAVNESASAALFTSEDPSAALSVGALNLSEIKDPSGRAWLTDLNEREEALVLMVFAMMFQPVFQPDANQTESPFEPPQFETITLGGKDAITFPVNVNVSESADSEVRAIEVKAIFAINADNLYFLIYGYDTEEGLGIVSEMLESFRFV